MRLLSVTILIIVALLLKEEVRGAPQAEDEARVVIAMATFGRRVRASSLRTIESVIAASRGRYARLIVSIPLARRFGSAPPEPSIDDVLAFYAQALGPFAPDASGFHYARHSVFVQFLREDAYGSATHVLGALLVEAAPDTVLLAIDDGVVYDASLFALFLRPGPAMNDDAAWAPACEGECETGGWLTGGVTRYRVGFFAADVWPLARNLSYACAESGDVWLSGYLRARGRRLVAAGGRAPTRRGAIPPLAIRCAGEYAQ